MLDIPLIVKEKRIHSPKGDVIHFLKKDSEGFTGFGEAYFSVIKPNVTKAWKLHKEATCNLTVLKGKVRFVIQMKNKSYAEFLLTVHDEDRLLIPPNLWFGFQNKNQEDSKILNIIDILHNPKEQISADLCSFDFNWS